MRLSDTLGILFPITIAVLLTVYHKPFEYATAAHPYIMGFLKVSMLATYGEMLKMRLGAGSWRIDHWLVRFIIWGAFGMLFTLVFAGFFGVYDVVVSLHLWPDWHWQVIIPVFDEPLEIWPAFSRSLFINVLFGFGYTMMVGHEYCNKSIDHGHVISLTAFAYSMAGIDEAKRWYRFIPLTLFTFWLAAHTITFMLPPAYFVLFAASLSVFLGMFLTVARRTRTS